MQRAGRRRSTARRRRASPGREDARERRPWPPSNTARHSATGGRVWACVESSALLDEPVAVGDRLLVRLRTHRAGRRSRRSRSSGTPAARPRRGRGWPRRHRGPLRPGRDGGRRGRRRRAWSACPRVRPAARSRRPRSTQGGSGGRTHRARCAPRAGRPSTQRRRSRRRGVNTLRPVARHHLGPAHRSRARVRVEQLTRFLERTVRIDQDRGADPDHRIVERGDERFEPARPDGHVRVQEADQFTRRLLHADLVPAGEPEVRLGLDDA